MLVKQLTDNNGTEIQPNAPDKVGYVDTSSSTPYSWDTTHTAPEDGWIRCGALTYANNGMNFYIDGVDMGYKGFKSDTTTFTYFPVKKGHTFKATGGSGYKGIEFFKLLANTDNGGGV